MVCLYIRQVENNIIVIDSCFTGRKRNGNIHVYVYYYNPNRYIKVYPPFSTSKTSLLAKERVSLRMGLTEELLSLLDFVLLSASPHVQSMPTGDSLVPSAAPNELCDGSDQVCDYLLDILPINKCS